MSADKFAATFHGPTPGRCIGGAIDSAAHKLYCKACSALAGEWVRLDAANADEDARGRVAQVLREFGHEENDSSNGWVLFADALGDIADALIAAGLIKGTSGNGPMLHGEDLRVASEKVDEWVREDAPVASPARVSEALMGHQLEWVEGAKTFDCTCNVDGSLDWLGTITEATQHQVAALLAAGVFRDEATVKAEAIREAAAEQRSISGRLKTRDGKWEHEGFADWLDDRAAALDPTRTEGAHP